MSGELQLTVDQAIALAKRWINRGELRLWTVNGVIELKGGEYYVPFCNENLLRTVHINAVNGQVMEPENGFLVSRHR